MSDLIAGSVQAAWGEAWERHKAAMMERTDVPIDQWKTAGRKTEEKPRGEDAEWWEIEGFRQVMAYLEWYASSDWQIYKVEGVIPMVEMDISHNLGGVVVKAFIDALMVHPETRELVVVDYKTGSKQPQATQLGVYRALLMEKMGLKVNKGAYFLTRKGHMSELIDLTRYTPAMFANVFSGFATAKDLNLYLPNVGDHCRWRCDVSNACAIVGGVDAYKYDPLHPAYRPDTSGKNQ